MNGIALTLSLVLATNPTASAPLGRLSLDEPQFQLPQPHQGALLDQELRPPELRFPSLGAGSGDAAGPVGCCLFSADMGRGLLNEEPGYVVVAAIIVMGLIAYIVAGVINPSKTT